jgi:FeS assembly protein IscX
MTWNDYAAIAEALNKRHPDEDLLAITDTRVEALVNELPGFSEKGTPPPPDIIQAIVTVWIDLQEPDGNRDYFWDAYI